MEEYGYTGALWSYPNDTGLFSKARPPGTRKTDRTIPLLSSLNISPSQISFPFLSLSSVNCPIVFSSTCVYSTQRPGPTVPIIGIWSSSPICRSPYIHSPLSRRLPRNLIVLISKVIHRTPYHAGLLRRHSQFDQSLRLLDACNLLFHLSCFVSRILRSS